MSAAQLVAGARAVVFDLDGTLADTAADLAPALGDALRERGLREVGRDLVLASLHGGLDATAAAALEALQQPATALPALARSYAAHYRRRMHRASTAYDGCAALLRALAGRGMGLAVCTNKSEAEARALLERLGLHRWTACVVGVDTTGHAKPHPAPLLHALARLRTPPAEAVLVGDSVVDAQCAQAAGVRFVLHARGYGAAGVPPAAAAARFDRYAELLAALEA